MLELRVAQAFGPLFDTHADEVAELLEDVKRSVGIILGDQGLTHRGVQERRAKVAAAAFEKLAELNGKRVALEQALKKAEADAPTRNVELRDLAGEVFQAAHLKQADLADRIARWRDRLVKLDPHIAAAELENAALNGEIAALLAADGLPGPVRAQLGDLSGYSAKYWRAMRPEAFTRLDATQSALRSFDSNVATARELVEQAAGASPAAQPLEVA